MTSPDPRPDPTDSESAVTLTDDSDWDVIDRMREAFEGVPFEEIEREAAKALAEVRAEMRQERENAERERAGTD
jgi:hypothetical protein